MTTKALQEGRLKKAKLDKTKARRERLAGERRLAEAAGRARRNDLLPDLQISQIPIGDLRGPRNRTRKDGPEQVERLVRSIAEFGFSQPVLVRQGQVLDGWTRVLAARELGLDHVPAIDCNHLDAAAARGLALALNRIAERGDWDLDALKIEFQELIDLDVDLGATGFTMEEQDIILLDPLDAQDADEDEVGAEPAVDPVTRIGDIWGLCEHRIISGNALEEGTYKALLGDERVHVVLTDPPYNVPIKGNVSGLGKKVHDEFVMASGEMSDAEFQAFLDKVLGLMTAWLVAGAVLFVFMDWRSIHRVYAAGEAAKLKLLNLVVWYKESGGMGALYRSAHELIAVLCKGDKPRVNNVELGRHGRDRANVWVAPGANRRGSSANEMLASHATPKPVELCVDALLDVTQRGDVVLDVFLGSGTTLIAAEKTGRVCRGIELEPGFVDVCIRRWERHTGKEAVLIRTGQTFRQVEAERYAGVEDLDDEAGLEAGGAK
ncbi:DNA modification methylase [Alteraurantiacibacter buctensis]|uniref:Methyltransferase n=1 Tax=Alteraurantiacibacter buctensis TaxID=1503981 RepID=A0A844Z3D9_9SPHN|nr:DNA methyltransferase [Alteraurantiacibacter buctensis]MXO73057.1 DNA methylase [Alteraurantiacibacter buctensis]